MHTLIVVDMLNDFVHPEGALYIGESSVVENVKKIIDGFRYNEYNQGKSSIIWICDSHTPDDKEFNRFPKHAVDGTWGAKIHDSLYGPKYVNSEFLIKKTRYSGFFGTDLERALAWMNPSMVEVAGVCTSICVMDTVGGLANRDYNIFVTKDAVDDFDKKAHGFALERMEKIYGATIL